uniref:Uncharacterized protein n=1 Tax=Oryza nivara TaxID=4536 RepID=A0A0E0FIQ7_ORYNI
MAWSGGGGGSPPPSLSDLAGGGRGRPPEEGGGRLAGATARGILVVLAILVGIIALIVYLVLCPTHPRFYLQDAALRQLDLSNSSSTAGAGRPAASPLPPSLADLAGEGRGEAGGSGGGDESAGRR